MEIWTPLHDRVVAMFVETVVDGWPCRRYPADWSARASAVLSDYDARSATRTNGGNHGCRNGHQAQLRDFLRRSANDPTALTGCEVGRIRLILDRYLQKRGAPNSPACNDSRRRQRQDVRAPLFHSIAAVVIQRLERHRTDGGLDDVQEVAQDVSGDEASASALPDGTAVPPSIQRKIERCLDETVAELVKRDVITSAEVIARVCHR